MSELCRNWFRPAYMATLMNMAHDCDIANQTLVVNGEALKYAYEIYTLNHNGVSVIARYNDDVSLMQPIPRSYIVTVQNNNSTLQIPTYKRYENTSFAKQIFNQMKETYQRQQKTKLAHAK